MIVNTASSVASKKVSKKVSRRISHIDMKHEALDGPTTDSDVTARVGGT